MRSRQETRILVVDDDGPIRTLVATVLRHRGFQVDTAGNGEEALERLGEGSYSLMILDLMMPLLSGYAVLDHLRPVTAANRPLILVLTAGFESRALDSEMVFGTLQKPFDVELLVETVVAALAARPVREQKPSDTPSSDGLPSRDPSATN